MLPFPKQSLVALTLASAVLATPLSFLDPLRSRDLERRQETCPPAYTTENGLNFTSYCGQNNPFNDAIIKDGIGQSFVTDSMQDCMEHCSRYWGNGEGCFGIVWVEDGSACWIRNSNVSTSSLEPLPGNHAALIDKSEMNGFDTSCPAADQSSRNTIPGVDGMKYTMHCDKVINGGDTCFNGVPCMDAPYRGFYHTETFEECLQICVEQHPLCRAVSWNPGLEIGFANCWPKTEFNDSSIIDPALKDGTLHSATITQINQIDTKCPESNTYTTENGAKKTFDIHCGKSNSGTHITSLHTQNVTACMVACAEDDQNCIGVSFDSSLAGGYSNCYLMNTTSVVSDQASTTYALLADTSLPSSSSTPSNSASSSLSSSKAWIAGPVIGGLVVLAVIGFAIFWWRRKKAAKPRSAEKEGHPLSNAGYGPAPAYSPTGNGAGFNGYYDGPAAASEMDARGTAEMPAPTTKFAHNQGPKSEAQELPTSTL